MVGSGPQEDDVARGTVHVGQTAAVFFPEVAQFAQGIRRCKYLLEGWFTRTVWKWATPGKFLRLVAIPSDDASAVPEHTDDSAVLPVGNFVLVRKFHDAEKVVRGFFQDVFPFFRLLLDIGNETWPRALFQFIKHGGFVFSH